DSDVAHQLITWGTLTCLRPSRPNSRPKPDFFTPPKGIRGSTAPCLLIHVVPASRRAATLRQASRSEPHTEEPSPTSRPLAHSMAWSRSVYLMIGSTGPNCSSATSGLSLSMSATSVVG